MFKTKPKTATLAAQTSNIPRTPFRFLWFAVKPHRLWMAAAAFIVLIVSSLEALSVLFIREVVTRAEAGLINEAIFFGVMYPVSVFILQSLWRISGYLGMRGIAQSRKGVYDFLSTYIFNHSHSYFIDRFAGSLISKVSNVVRSVERMGIDFLWHHTPAFVGLIASSLIIMSIDLYSGLIFQALVLSLCFLNYKLLPKKRELSKISSESDTYLRGRLVDIFSNITATRQYVRRSDEAATFSEITDSNLTAYTKSWWYSEYMRILNSIVLVLFSVAMFLVLSVRWESGVISTGDFVAVMVTIFNVSGMLIFIGRIFNDTASAYGEMEEGLEEILIDHEIVDQADAEVLRARGGEINWDNVSFEFGANNIFKDFNLIIKPGERVGLVGPSGAGKTTFVSLLLRQHDIQKGSIMIDGQNIAEVTQDSLRQSIAVVPQEPLLFHRTVRENIAYGKPNASDKEIEEVARKAQAYDFIVALEDGFDTMVGERGVKLSGGQKQRVAIARAMLKDAPILVLDEATSALDSESEVAIQTALHKLMEGKTVVAIAHRLSTLREMDRILVLEAGEIVEDGNHESLAKAGGTYQRLWEHQAGGFLPG